MDKNLIALASSLCMFVANSLGHNNHNMWLELFIDIFKIILKEGVYLILKSI